MQKEQADKQHALEMSLLQTNSSVFFGAVTCSSLEQSMLSHEWILTAAAGLRSAGVAVTSSSSESDV